MLKEEVSGFTVVYLASSASAVLSILVYIFFVHKKINPPAFAGGF